MTSCLRCCGRLIIPVVVDLLPPTGMPQAHIHCIVYVTYKRALLSQPILIVRNRERINQRLLSCMNKRSQQKNPKFKVIMLHVCLLEFSGIPFNYKFKYFQLNTWSWFHNCTFKYRLENLSAVHKTIIKLSIFVLVSNNRR